MWKFTGWRSSWAVAHIGSQCGSVRCGRPKADGSWEKTMPRWPIASQRSISARVASRSQNGSVVTAMSRSGAALHHSVWKSL